MTVQDRKGKSDIKPQTFKFFEGLLAASIDGIVITDNTHNIIVTNKTFCSFFGQNIRNMLETSLLDWLNQCKDDGPGVWSKIDKEVRHRGFCHNIEFCIMAMKKKRYFSVNASVLEQTDNEESSIISIWRDVTDQKQKQEELNKLNRVLMEKADKLEKSEKALTYLLEDVNEIRDNLERANIKLKELDQLKSMFIASMSHELRTPLNSIIGFTGIILQGIDGEINPQQKNHLGRANRSAKHLLSLINDIIDLSKVEAGKVDIFLEDIVLDEVISDAVENVRLQANEKRLALDVSVPHGVRMNTDRRRLYQCILNYLSNAVKFTETGTISITAHDTNGEVEIIVSDTGIGISRQNQQRLFKPFVRIDSHLRAKTLGTGLGLYLTRKLITELLGGTVDVQSQPGKGSTFTLRLPKVIKG
jgi:PAS domain S-box-containing protein